MKNIQTCNYNKFTLDLKYICNNLEKVARVYTCLDEISNTQKVYTFPQNVNRCYDIKLAKTYYNVLKLILPSHIVIKHMEYKHDPSFNRIIIG